jgi:hypothetical protein
MESAGRVSTLDRSLDAKEFVSVLVSGWGIEAPPKRENDEITNSLNCF